MATQSGYNGNPQRVMGWIVLLLGAVGAAIEFAHAGASVLALISIILGFIGAGVLMAMGNLVEKPAVAPSLPAANAAPSIELAIRDLKSAVERTANDRLDHREPEAVASSPAVEQINRIVQLLEEIREVSLMSDAQRQARLQQHAQHRKQAWLAAIDQHIRREEWSQADQLLQTLAEDFPNDHSINAARTMLETGRNQAETEAYEHVRSSVEDMMAVGSWDQAHETIAAFCANYPLNQQAVQLMNRVTHERDVYRENTVKRLYDQTKHYLERREWRNALGNAQKLLERFPDHPKTQKIRQQARVIQSNAEIEERQDQESRIQQLIKSKRFDEAIELSEDLIRRFPLSPQAEAIEDMLPKLRELGVKEEAQRLSE